MAHSATAVTGAQAHALDRSEKRDLASWWKNFKGRDRRDKIVHEQQQQQQVPRGIFGVPLQESILYANVAISLLNDEGQSYIYGYVPIVVAKCGVYLKEKATDVEGIFRLAGSEKRIKELKAAFDSPDRYGKGLDWAGYTVHDAANILRRYFNQLPEPIIPLEFYEPFRDPLRNHQEQAVGAPDAHSQGSFDKNGAIRKYQRLITELPPLNRQLLLYILDLLAVFASKSDMNKMTTANLSAIFQPGILSHPQHDMAPQEYRLSQDVLIFLIENQDHFLIGMQGTGADPETIRGVQSGAPTPPKATASPGSPRAKAVGRTSSNASAGAESIARWGSLRRNVSVSSRHSKPAEAGTLSGDSPATPTGSPGVYRSNTVPSRRAGSNSNQNSPRFSRDQKPTDPPTPLGSTIATAIAIDMAKPRQESLQSTPIALQTPRFPEVAQPAPDIVSPSSSEATTPLAVAGSQTSSVATRDHQTPKRDTTPLLAPPSAGPASSSSSRGFLDLFKQSPTSDGEGSRKPNKLQKKARVASSALSSAQSSSADLTQDVQADGRSPTAATTNTSNTMSPSTGNPAVTQQTLAYRERDPIGAALGPSTSPSGSYHSTTEDTSDADYGGDDLPRTDLGGLDANTAEKADRAKRRHRWRFSRTPNRMEPSSPPSGESLGSGARDMTASRSTVGSAGARRSFQDARGTSIDPTLAATTSPTTTGSESVFSDSERERRTASTSGTAGGAAAAGPMQWIRGKLHKEKGGDGERRVARTGASPLLGPTATTPVAIEPLGEPEKVGAYSGGAAEPTNATLGQVAGSVATAPDSLATPKVTAPIGASHATDSQPATAVESVQATSQTA